MTDEVRHRLVVLGSSKVGKTALIRRYLYQDFTDKYKETVEDLHSRDFHIHGDIISLDILDTNFNYPDMRRLAIASANAFLLVFAVDDVNSFKEMSEMWSEISKKRGDIDTVPIVIVGNKVDSATKKIYPETAQVFISRHNSRSELRYVEVSAKTGDNVHMIFRNLLEISERHKAVDEAASKTSLSARTASGGSDDCDETRSAAGGDDGIRRPPKSSHQQLMKLSRESSPNMTLPSPARTAKTSTLCRNRSLKLRSTKADDGQQMNRKTSDDPSKAAPVRQGSLIRRTKQLSLRSKKVNGDSGAAAAAKANQIDESDCKIS